MIEPRGRRYLVYQDLEIITAVIQTHGRAPRARAPEISPTQLHATPRHGPHFNKRRAMTRGRRLERDEFGTPALAARRSDSPYGEEEDFGEEY